MPRYKTSFQLTNSEGLNTDVTTSDSRLLLTLRSPLPTPLLEKPEEFSWIRGRNRGRRWASIEEATMSSASAPLCVSHPSGRSKQGEKGSFHGERQH